MGIEKAIGQSIAFTLSAWQYRLKRFMRGYRKRDAHQKSEQAENKFSAYGEQVQKELRTSSKLAEMRIKENSLAQQKNFPWAREKIPLSKRTSPFSYFRKMAWGTGFISCRFPTLPSKLPPLIKRKGKCRCPKCNQAQKAPFSNWRYWVPPSHARNWHQQSRQGRR